MAKKKRAGEKNTYIHIRKSFFLQFDPVDWVTFLAFPCTTFYPPACNAAPRLRNAHTVLFTEAHRAYTHNCTTKVSFSTSCGWEKRARGWISLDNAPGKVTVIFYHFCLLSTNKKCTCLSSSSVLSFLYSMLFFPRAFFAEF